MVPARGLVPSWAGLRVPFLFPCLDMVGQPYGTPDLRRFAACLSTGWEARAIKQRVESEGDGEERVAHYSPGRGGGEARGGRLGEARSSAVRAPYPRGAS